MFTLKHQHDNGETLYQGKEPFYHADMDSSDGQTVSYLNEFGVRIYITGGIIYVMNDQGRTVAKYDLGGMSQPALSAAA